MQWISLSMAAKIITEVSGFRMTRDQLRILIVTVRWKYAAQKLNMGWVVPRKAAHAFAKTFKGTKVGRPVAKRRAEKKDRAPLRVNALKTTIDARKYA